MMGKSVSCFVAFAKSTMSFLTVVMSAVRLSSLFDTAPAVAGEFPAPNFTAPGTFDAGANCFSVAVGDFNGDGASDLAVADIDSDKVSVLLSRGDGTFQPAANYAVGMAPVSVAVADFNGDGKLDLAVASYHVWDNSKLGFTNGIVSVLLGKGDGSFRAAVNYSAGMRPFSIAVSDFNGDGKPDLAVANFISGDVSVLLGKGDGTFQAAVNYVAGVYRVAAVVSDFNSDGGPDMVVANEESDNVSVMLGKGDGTFQSAVNYCAGAGPRSVAVGDFNKDGKTDLIVANWFSRHVSMLVGKGDGTFQSAVNYTA